MKGSTIRITTLTPTHVGATEPRQPLRKGLDYRVEGDRIHVVDPRTLPLEDAGRYAEAIRRRDWNEAERILIRAETLWTARNRCGRPPLEFTPTYRPRPDLPPHLPGTSLKGALRTGLLIAALRELERNGHPLHTLTDRLPRGRGKNKALDTRLRVTIFQLGSSFRPGSSKKGRNDWPTIHPHADVLRGLSVSDAEPSEDLETEIHEPELIPRGRRIDPREFIPDSVEFKAEIRTDPRYVRTKIEKPRKLHPSVFQFLKDVRPTLRNFWEDTLESPERTVERAREGWRIMLETLRRKLRTRTRSPDEAVPEDADAQIGWGGGRYTKTVLALESVLPGFLRRWLEPKTFRLVDRQVPGLVLIET